MTEPTDVWSRLKQVRVVRVLLVYLGASWVVLQVTQTIVEAFKLSDWVLPTAIILLVIGLVIVVATAWVQSLASTTAGEESGALPTDWEIAPRDAIASLRKGRLPHLTWGRAIAGGVVTLVLLFAGAGGYVGLTRLHLGPAPASASEAATGIAIVPFEVRGTGMDIWREGMMDLMSHELDGVGGFRAIDSRTVLARWNERVGNKPADPSTTLDVAKATGARYALEGSVIALGPTVRLIATVYEIESGKQVGDAAQVEGPADSVLQLVDRLGVATLRSLLSSVGREGAADASAESITTTSMPAMRAYLEGEQYYRKAKFPEAVQSFEKAVALDSTFAIALVELSDAYGWLENSQSAKTLEVGRLAYAQRDRLSPRYQFIMQGWDALNRNSAEGVASLKAAAAKYPDDARVWFLLAETYIHVGGPTYGTDDELWDALQRATNLDPSFAPFLQHLAETAILRGDSATARKVIDRYVKLTGSDEDVRRISIAIPIVLGTDQEAAAAIKLAANLPAHELDGLNGTFAAHHDHFDRDAKLDSIFADVSKTNRAHMQAWYAGAAADLTRGNAAAANPAIPAAMRAQYYAYMYTLWNVQPPAGVLEKAECAPRSGICFVLLAQAYANMGRWSEHEALIRNLRAAAATEKDSIAARKYVETSEIVRAVGLQRHGDLDGARTIYLKFASESSLRATQVRYQLGILEADAKHPAEALKNFSSIRNGITRPAGLLGSAMMYEQLGQPDKARAEYAHFITLTAHGDQSLPAIVRARAAYARLQGKN